MDLPGDLVEALPAVGWIAWTAGRRAFPTHLSTVLYLPLCTATNLSYKSQYAVLLTWSSACCCKSSYDLAVAVLAEVEITCLYGSTVELVELHLAVLTC
jgi:hypothetical protein